MNYNRKGHALGVFLAIFIFIFLVLAIAISFPSANLIQDKITEGVMANVDSIQDASGDSLNATDLVNNTLGEGSKAVDMLQWISYVVIAALFIGIIGLTYLVRTNPWWVGAYFLGLILLIIIAHQVGNAYEEISNQEALASTYDKYEEQSIVLDNLEWWILMLGAVGAIIMITQIGKKSNEGVFI